MKRMRQTCDATLGSGAPRLRPEDIAVYFVEIDPKGDQTLIREMPLNERGELVKAWPGGFFGGRPAGDLLMPLLADYAITPDVFDKTSYLTAGECGARLETIREVMLTEGLGSRSARRGVGRIVQAR